MTGDYDYDFLFLFQDLLKALKGLVVMSEQLEMMSNSLFNNQVPDLWAGKVSMMGTY